VITNKSVRDKYGVTLHKRLRESGFGVKFKLVPDTEKSKSINTAYSVIEDIAGYDKKRRLFIVALGGGVIGDLAGFIASIYKRGIPYIQVPTTLLAQVDSSIGGKTAIDLMQGKNLVGAFYQPRLVFSEVKFLKTLPQRQLKSGLAEVIKYGIIKDASFFGYIERKYGDILGLKDSALEFIVWRCSLIKAGIVERDEREVKGIRTILNFGHTIGHAIEAASGYTGYTHGEAIALGMLVGAEISVQLGMIDLLSMRRIENLIAKTGLPTTIRRLSLDRIIEAHYRDKKFIGGKSRFVLLRNIGTAVVRENIPPELIRNALRSRGVRG
jgi:3-dehydroquinate synthase